MTAVKDETGNNTPQPSYKLYININSKEARPFIQVIFKLIRAFSDLYDIRGSTNKTGYRLQFGNSTCDFIYNFDATCKGFTIQTQFLSGSSNAMAGRVITLLGIILMYHKKIGKPLSIDIKRSTLSDIQTVEKWGEWGLGELYKHSAGNFPELCDAYSSQQDKKKTQQATTKSTKPVSNILGSSTVVPVKF